MNMIKALQKHITPFFALFLFFFFHGNGSLMAQSNIWRAIKQTGNVSDTLKNKCEYISNGTLRIAPAPNSTEKYKSSFRFLDTVCLSQNFTFEIKLRNSAALGGHSNFSADVLFFSNGLPTGFKIASGTEGVSTRSVRVADSVVTSGATFLTTDLSSWRTIRMRFFDDTLSFFIDNKLEYKTKYTRNICNADILDIAFEGGGAVDEIRFFDNLENLIFLESFDNCEKLTPGIKCDPAVPISVKISPSCLGDTLTMCANFPAMSFLWSPPTGEKVRSACFTLPNLTPEKKGVYDLTANINRCFVFTKQIPIDVFPKSKTEKEVSLCVGQTLRLSNGRLVDKAGIYPDTLKTIQGCDSIILYTVKIGNEQRVELKQEGCVGSCIALPSGRQVCMAGTYADTVREASGCLIFYSVNFVTTSKVEKSLFFEMCEGGSVVLPKGMTVRSAGIFRDTFETSRGCDSIVISTVVVKNTITKTQDIRICEGASYTLPSKKVVKIAGFYRDTLKTVGGCDSIIVTNLSFVTPSVPIINGVEKKEFEEGEQVTISTVATPQYTYQWRLKNESLGTGNVLNLTIPAGENVIKLIAKSAEGCEATSEITLFGVPKLEIPTAFSPNGDEVNDYFSIVVKAEGFYQVEMLEIFDRSGRRIYNQTNNARGWDGKNNGDECASDVYIYRLSVKNKAGATQQYQGEVLLLR